MLASRFATRTVTGASVGDVTDDGGAVAAAGVASQRMKLPSSIDVGEFSASVSRQGEVSLPGVAGSSDEWLTKLPELVAEGSLALCAALLESQD